MRYWKLPMSNPTKEHGPYMWDKNPWVWAIGFEAMV